jgi:small subunit ribosomal protein S17
MSYERRKVKTGRVVSDKMDRTVVVQVEWRSPHRLYKKPIRRMSKFKVHDPENISMVGDLVQVMESRPRSKTKRWRLLRVLQRSETVDILPEEIGQDAIIAEVSGPAMDPAPEPDVEVDMVAEPAAEVDSAAEAEPAEETEPVAEVDSAVEAESAEEAEPVAEVDAAVEAEPAEEAEPVAEVDATVEADSPEEAEVEPAVETESGEESEPAAEVESGAEPAAELQPEAETPSDGTDGKTETEPR